MSAKRSTSQRNSPSPEESAQESAPDEEPTESVPDQPAVNPTAISTKETDFLGRSLITPGTDSKDYLGRATTATADHLGRLLLDV